MVSKNPQATIESVAAKSCRFGTDGVRGRVGQEPMVPVTLVKLGYAIGTVLGGCGQEVVIGKDTRLSGYMVESAIEAGLAATGIDIALTGPLPTSAVARLVAEENAAAGIVISASHNPHQDNGIKILDAQGNKLSDAMEAEIEHLVLPTSPLPDWASEPGKARRIDDALARYVEFCLATAPSLDLRGMNIVIDAANGAAYAAAPDVLRKAGASVHEIGCRPDGRNINVGCGAQEPWHAAEFVSKHSFDLGIVLDGDADRLIMVDATGHIVDGDAYLYAICSCLAKLGRKPAGVVGTLMSNCALEAALAGMDIGFARASVGDRNVALELAQRGWLHGSEPSGHVLLPELHPAGDGIIAALTMLNILAQAGVSLADAVANYHPMPSVNRNLPTADPISLAAKLAPAVAQEENVAGMGRIVLRASGTEPVLRLLVESADEALAQQAIERISALATAG